MDKVLLVQFGDAHLKNHPRGDTAIMSIFHQTDGSEPTAASFLIRMVF